MSACALVVAKRKKEAGPSRTGGAPSVLRDTRVLTAHVVAAVQNIPPPQESITGHTYRQGNYTIVLSSYSNTY